MSSSKATSSKKPSRIPTSRCDYPSLDPSSMSPASFSHLVGDWWWHNCLPLLVGSSSRTRSHLSISVPRSPFTQCPAQGRAQTLHKGESNQNCMCVGEQVPYTDQPPSRTSGALSPCSLCGRRSGHWQGPRPHLLVADHAVNTGLLLVQLCAGPADLLAGSVQPPCQQLHLLL